MKNYSYLRCIVLWCLVFNLPLAEAQIRSISRISIASDGTESNGLSDHPVLSENAAVVAFQSEASNLVQADTNQSADIFIYDSTSSASTKISRVSIGSEGQEGVGASGNASADQDSISISNDGRFVAFTSSADALVNKETSNVQEVLIRDRQAGSTSLVSRLFNGSDFTSDALSPDVSDDGRYVCFASVGQFSDNDTNQVSDVFLVDTSLATTTLISRTAAGTSGDGASSAPILSANGRYLFFSSNASNLVVSGATQGILTADLLQTTSLALRKNVERVFQRSGTFTAYPDVSPEGRFLVFVSSASAIVDSAPGANTDIFLIDKTTGSAFQINKGFDGSTANGPSYRPKVSADGRYIAFLSFATNLIPNDTNGVADIFVYDRVLDVTLRASVGDKGQETTTAPTTFSLSRDGTYIAFASDDSNLIANDTNKKRDIFLVRTGEVLTPATVISDPPIVAAQRKRIRVVMKPFGTATNVASSQRFKAIEGAAALDFSNIQIQYVATLKTSVAIGDDLKRKTSKKNVITFNNLPPGNYSVRYRVQATVKKKNVFQTNLSPVTKVKLKK